MSRKMENLTGRLDRFISELMVASQDLDEFDAADRQTLKHHIEDLALCNNAVALRLRKYFPRFTLPPMEPQFSDAATLQVKAFRDLKAQADGKA